MLDPAVIDPDTDSDTDGSETLRALATIAAFVAIAVGFAAAERQLGRAVDPAYSSGAVDSDPSSTPQRPSLWLVDGFNLLHAAVLRSGDSRKEWWKSANRERVLALARGFEDRDAEVVVVFDGSEVPDTPSEGGPRVVFAAPADDWLLAAVKAAPNPHRVAVVTADRRLADRLRDRGAQVVPPSAFAARCRGVDAPERPL
jgi:YacP-like NYN domain